MADVHLADSGKLKGPVSNALDLGMPATGELGIMNERNQRHIAIQTSRHVGIR